MKSKEASRLYKIGEIEEMLGIRQSTIRYWESVFKHIKPIKGTGGIRYYSDKEISQIKVVEDLLHIKKLTIEGAKSEIINMKKREKEKIEIDESNKNFNKEEVLSELKSILAILK